MFEFPGKSTNDNHIIWYSLIIHSLDWPNLVEWCEYFVLDYFNLFPHAHETRVSLLFLSRTLTMDEHLTELLKRFWQWRLQEAPELGTMVGEHSLDYELDDMSMTAYDRRLVSKLYSNLHCNSSSKFTASGGRLLSCPAFI